LDLRLITIADLKFREISTQNQIFMIHVHQKTPRGNCLGRSSRGVPGTADAHPGIVGRAGQVALANRMAFARIEMKGKCNALTRSSWEGIASQNYAKEATPPLRLLRQYDISFIAQRSSVPSTSGNADLASFHGRIHDTH
jgi:hypothetical protein